MWLAIGLGLAVLALEGFVFARLERLGWSSTALVVTLNVGLGVLDLAEAAPRPPPLTSAHLSPTVLTSPHRAVSTYRTTPFRATTVSAQRVY